MGVDFKSLYRVINYGPPNDIESYVQVEMGEILRQYFFSMVANFDFVTQRSWILLSVQLAEGKKSSPFLMTVMKTAKSSQATYVATSVPKTVSVDKQNVKKTQA